nr:hypothetical protein MACL_00001748 [Theileria orientalis]
MDSNRILMKALMPILHSHIKHQKKSEPFNIPQTKPGTIILTDKGPKR